MTETHGFKKWAPLIVMSLALLIIVLDTTILNVSLRTIVGDLGTTLQKIQWVITAYSLVLAAFTITGGRLGDLFGRKKMFVIGAVIFAVGSFITSISHSVGVMIWGEAIVEGLGAAIMMPATSSLIVSCYSGRDRQIAFGIWGGIAAAGAALGPVFGGWLTTYYSWRWAFRINVFVAAVLVLGSFILAESKDTHRKPGVDFVGIILSAVGLLTLVYGFIESSTYGWWHAKEVFAIGSYTQAFSNNMSVVPVAIELGIFIILLFVLWEVKRERAGKTVLVSSHLFKNKQFVVGATITAILSLALAGTSFSLPIFFQGVKNLNAFHTGLAMLPMSLALLVLAPLSAYFSKHITPRTIIQVGLGVAGLGFLVLALSLGVGASEWRILPGLLLYGAGMGLMMSQASNITLSAVPVREAGEASGVNGTMRQLGGALGAAILGAIVLSFSSANFGTAAADPGAIVRGSQISLYASIAFVLLAFIISFWLPHTKNVEQHS